MSGRPSSGSLYRVNDQRGWPVGSTMCPRIAAKASRRYKGSHSEWPLPSILTPEALARLDTGDLIFTYSFDRNGRLNHAK